MTVKQFLDVVELRTKVVSLSTLACATAYAWRETGKLDPTLLGLAFLAVLLVDMGTTAFNSFFDYWRGDDRTKRLQEADKVLVTQGVPALAALLIAALCYLLAACLGLVLAFKAGAWVIGLGALCLAAGFFYSGGPYPISRSPVGELVAGAFLGTALFLIAYRIQAGSWNSRALLASLPGLLFIASILAVNNACDIVGDREAERRTLAILLGPKAAAALPPALGLAAFASTLALSLCGVLPLGSALSGGLAAMASVPIYSRMRKAGFSHDTKSASMRRIIAAFSLWSVGYLAGILLGQPGP
jgi:1,4-dihydroxy-2-naphthoate octaprenyltransferase